MFFLNTIFVILVVNNYYLREHKESKHWLRMVTKAVPHLNDEAKIN